MIAGYYIYIETSLPRKINETAVLVSPIVNSQNDVCLKFWYHMFGQDINNLQVLTTDVMTGQQNVIWRRFETQGNIWRPASITLVAPTNITVRLN